MSPTSVVCFFGAPREPLAEAGPTVDPDVHAGVVVAAREAGTSVSAWMTDAARRALIVQDGLRAVAEWETEHGPLTDAERCDARRHVAEEVAAAAPRRT